MGKRRLSGKEMRHELRRAERRPADSQSRKNFVARLREQELARTRALAERREQDASEPVASLYGSGGYDDGYDAGLL